MGHVTPAAMYGTIPAPVDFVLTTVARIVDQDDPPLARIAAVREQLRAVGPEQFLYPLASMHITLLGCTQRHEARHVFTKDRTDAVIHTCERVLTGKGPVPMTLRGMGIIGNQVFIQVYPHNNNWAEMRVELEEELVRTGECPITYPDKRPIHLNVMRITHGDRQCLDRIVKLIEEDRRTDFGTVSLSHIAFMITDFVLSPANSEELGTFALVR